MSSSNCTFAARSVSFPLSMRSKRMSLWYSTGNATASATRDSRSGGRLLGLVGCPCAPGGAITRAAMPRIVNAIVRNRMASSSGALLQLLHVNQQNHHRIAPRAQFVPDTRGLGRRCVRGSLHQSRDLEIPLRRAVMFDFGILQEIDQAVQEMFA